MPRMIDALHAQPHSKGNTAIYNGETVRAYGLRVPYYLDVRDIEPDITIDVTNAHVVDVGNVAHYYFAEDRRESWQWPNEFPGLMPPFQSVWLEAKTPTHIVKGDTYVRQTYRNNGIERFAILATRYSFAEFVGRHTKMDIYDAAGAPMPGETTRSVWQRLTDAGAMHWLNIRLIFEASMPSKTWPVGVVGPMCGWDVMLDGNGDGMTFDIGSGEKKHAVFYEWFNIDKRLPQFAATYEALVTECTKFLDVGLLSLSFMNCKNVRVVERVPDAHANRQHERKFGTGLVKHHVIEITPMRYATARTSKGTKQVAHAVPSLHVRRGHFKSFGERYGRARLFGKHEGRYWWENSLVGDVRSGMVESDYKVNAPNETETTT